jgi:predicted signal transduction protein with EAL and GGDEF domain
MRMMDRHLAGHTTKGRIVLRLNKPGCAMSGAETARRMEAALDHAPVGLILLDRRGRVSLMSARAGDLLGLAEFGACVGRAFRRVLAISRLSAADAAALLEQLSANVQEPMERLVTVGNGAASRTLMMSVRPSGRLGWVVSIDDVTQSRQTQDWLLEHLSSDPVTGLWNSHHFMLMLQDRLVATKRAGNQDRPVVLLIGLRPMPHVHEFCNTAMFDRLMQMIGERIAGCLLPMDVLARLPRDQFAAVLTRPEGTDAIAQLCARIVAALNVPLVLDGQTITPGAFIGIACAPRHGTTPDELLGNAGLALIAAAETDPAAKTERAWRFFDTQLMERVAARRAFEADLRQALAKGELELHYQPQVDVCQGRVSGLEALVRWRSPRRGLVPPSAFIPLAEDLGLIGEIGDWVLAEACRAAATWPEDITIAVNASPLQVESGNFAASVARALENAGLPAHRLEVEVTENLLLSHTEQVAATLAAVQALGVRLVLDDFGTGYASLSQLSRFPFGKIKIDRSFVSPAVTSGQHSAIVRSIAALGRSLGIPTIAEGVETANQLEQIKADGCTCVQGYYFSRPIPGADVRHAIDHLGRPASKAAA